MSSAAKASDRVKLKLEKLDLISQRFKIKARKTLLGFTKYTKEDYRANWHHEEYSKVLDSFIAGDIKRLMVFMPPQHGKSELCSRRMPAKILGDFPNKRVAVCAYNHPFAAKFNRDVQRIIDSPEYKELYPETTLSGKNIRSDASGSWLRNSDEFEIVGHRGSLISVGIGGGLTGNKVDVAIVDDPYKDPAQANSEAYRKRLVEWWDQVLETRLNNDGQICLTFTRWRHDDIAGHLLELQEAGITTDEWTIVRFQGIKEEGNHATDEYNAVEDPRAAGEALWPEEHSADRLLNMKAKNPIAYEALYQQDPTPLGGNIIKDEYLKRYLLNELPEGVNHAYIDTATSESELKNNDPTGILIYRVYQNKLYLIYFIKGRWSSPELIEKIKWVSEKFLQGRRSKIYIENKSNGRSTKQTLDRGTNLNVILENIKGKKQERLENELSTLESGRVLIPLNEHWSEDFKKQCLGFPLIKHDEEIDCLTGAMRTGLKEKGGSKFARQKR